MPRRESDGPWIVCDFVKPQGRCVADENAEDASASRQVADLAPRLLVDACRDEALEPCTCGVDHAQRRVPCTGQLRRGLDELLQQRVERELRRERDAGLDRSE